MYIKRKIRQKYGYKPFSNNQKGMIVMDNNDKKRTFRLPGFYIALSCCVLAIGAAGFISQKLESRSEETTEVAETNEGLASLTDTDSISAPDGESSPLEDEPAEDAPRDAEPASAEQKVEDVPVIEDYAIDNPDIAPASITVNAEDGGMFLAPVPSGTILEGFSDGRLVYNNILCDWRAHNGIDLAADMGCSVSAAADGTVTSVGSGSYGKYVTIDHGNGFSATYAQLNDINVNEGDSVSAGSVIGTVAKCQGENIGEPHLHYELTKDGAFVNPEEY